MTLADQHVQKFLSGKDIVVLATIQPNGSPLAMPMWVLHDPASLAMISVEGTQKVRNLRGHGLEEGVSTRLLIYAAQLISNGIAPIRAAEVAMCSPITDDRDLQRSIREIITTVI